MSDDNYFDVMVDLETTGTDPDLNAIVQIAAVRFDYPSKTIDTSSFFKMGVEIPYRRAWDEDTRNWWLNDPTRREVFIEITRESYPPAAVLKTLNDWLNEKWDQSKPLRFWSRPSHFDFMFLQSYYKQFGVHNPFHYRHAMDQNSFIRGLSGDPDGPLYFHQRQGDAHNAIMDCLNQIGDLFGAAAALTTPQVEDAEVIDG